MRWLLFRRRPETPAAKDFDALLDDVIEDFDQAVETHRSRLEALREVLRDR